MEEFAGVKFKVLLKQVQPAFSPLEKALADELLEWGKKFAKEGLAPQYAHEQGTRSAGNLSFRASGGFVITASGKDFSTASLGDLVVVKKCNFEEGVVHAEGLKRPSSETLMHFLIYENRRDVNAVLHGHDELVLGKARELGFAETGHEVPYGSKELAKETLNALGENGTYAVIKGHGFASVGESIQAAGNAAISAHNKAAVLMI